MSRLCLAALALFALVAVAASAAVDTKPGKAGNAAAVPAAVAPPKKESDAKIPAKASKSESDEPKKTVKTVGGKVTPGKSKDTKAAPKDIKTAAKGTAEKKGDNKKQAAKLKAVLLKDALAIKKLVKKITHAQPAALKALKSKVNNINKAVIKSPPIGHTDPKSSPKASPKLAQKAAAAKKA